MCIEKMSSMLHVRKFMDSTEGIALHRCNEVANITLTTTTSLHDAENNQHKLEHQNPNDGQLEELTARHRRL